jgi:hypothetical protein
MLRTTGLCAAASLIVTLAGAEEFPFSQQVSAADRALVMRQLGMDPADVKMEDDLKIAKIDLNRDGRPDYVVLATASQLCGSAGCATSIVLSEGQGYRRVLDALTHDITLGERATLGMPDVILGGKSRWTWDGNAYRPAPAVEFRLSDELPDDPAGAREYRWKNGRLARLAPLIGTDAYATVLKDPDVSVALAARMTPADLKTLVLNLGHPTIQYIGGHLVLEGFRPHLGGQEMATVWIDLDGGKVRAAMLHEGRMHVFADSHEFRGLPPALRAWIVSPLTHEEAPPGIVWHR